MRNLCRSCKNSQNKIQQLRGKTKDVVVVLEKRLKLHDACCGETSVREKKRA